MGWGVRSPIAGQTSSSGTPIVSVRQPTIFVRKVHFANAANPQATHFHYLYANADTHPIAPGRLQWWARGLRLTEPEWVANRAEENNLRACLTRRQPVEMSVNLVAATAIPLTATLSVTPKLNGDGSFLLPTSVTFTYPAHAAEHWVNVTLRGHMPDEIGLYLLELNWNLTGTQQRKVNFGGPARSRLRVYSIYGQPLLPGYDSAADSDPGQPTTRDEGTLSGTRKRLDHLMRLIGGQHRRHPAATPADIIDLIWRMHVGINDTPGAPPYFDAGHTEFLTDNGNSDVPPPNSSYVQGHRIPLEDQWLAWVPNGRQWNDASCIGHVQILKTMAAAIGLFARRTWVFPHTTRLPNGTTTSFSDSDLYCLGNFDPAKSQRWHFTHHGHLYLAAVRLMEPGLAWENFEACLRSPNGRFLTGGYQTSSCPPAFRANQGFSSALELLRWWCHTSRPSFGPRFMCWVHFNTVTGETHCWDVDGTHYDPPDYLEIRRRGKQLPPP